MRALIARAAILAALAIPAALASATPAAAQPPVRSTVDVTLDQHRSSVAVGDRLTIHARITNAGTEPTERLIAHLNVTTLDQAVYVDLEDWTAGPTQELAPVPPGGSTSAAWEIQAVNVGRFAVYAVVLPNGATSDGQGPLVTSAPYLVEVAGRRTLSPAGALPVDIAEPVLLGLVAVAVRLRLRRGR